MDKVLTFGKYKGKKIKDIIETHIGYIMWCLKNLSWFKLNDEEQYLFDLCAISIIKCEKIIDASFPINDLRFLVKDWDALDQLKKKHPEQIKKYRTCHNTSCGSLSAIPHEIDKADIIAWSEGIENDNQSFYDDINPYNIIE